MKIAFIELIHITRGAHANTVPLACGLISRYLQKTLSHDLEIRIFKDTEKALAAFKSWAPDILGISQYAWNSELNLHVAKFVKEKINPDCLVVAGGPNLERSEFRKAKFFKAHPDVDICVSYDGEIPVAEIVNRLCLGENRRGIINNPPVGTSSFDIKKQKIVEPLNRPPRLTSIDIFGSMYADGFFNEFLDAGFHPFLQSHRGCPFACAFCHSSDPYNSQVLFLDPEIFKRDMEYLGKRFTGRHDVVLYLANTNMGLFKEDFVIAKIISEIQKKYDWPRYINSSWGKNPRKLLEMLSILKYIQPSIALQTLTPEVLRTVRRINIRIEDYIDFQRQVLKKTGVTSCTELILGLPGETKKSFLETVKAVLNSGVQDIIIIALMKLKSTPISSEEFENKYKYIVKHRVVPRQFSIVRGEKILDTEEVVVGTDTMSYQDYLAIRGLCFTITIFFSSTELIPLKRLMLEYGVLMSDWVFGIHSRLAEFSDLKSQYDNFMLDTEKELFNSREELMDFFSQEENFQALYSGRLGDNLLRKYKFLTLSYNYKAVLKLALAEADKLLRERVGKEKIDSVINDMSLYLAEREVREVFENSDFSINKRVVLNYDIPKWMSQANEESRLENLSGLWEYTVKLDEKIKAQAKDFIQANKDSELSLQILYRDGNIRDFWPKWAAGKNL